MQITIGDATTLLALPKSATVRFELAKASAGGQVTLRLAAATVGSCWPGRKGRPAGDFDGDVATYGREAADDLIGRGATVVEIVRAGAECLAALFADGIPGMAEVKAAADPYRGRSGGLSLDFIIREVERLWPEEFAGQGSWGKWWDMWRDNPEKAMDMLGWWWVHTDQAGIADRNAKAAAAASAPPKPRRATGRAVR